MLKLQIELNPVTKQYVIWDLTTGQYKGWTGDTFSSPAEALSHIATHLPTGTFQVIVIG